MNLFPVLNANLLSLSGLSYSAASFVKMTAANTFSLDTNSYSLSNHNHSGVYEPAFGFSDYFNQAVKTTSSPTFSNITDSGLTSGRIPYASSGGLLTDNAGLTFDGTRLRNTGYIYFDDTYHNIFLGLQATPTATGLYNVGIGNGCLASLSSGGGNFAIGSLTLTKVTSSNYNVAIGYTALQYNTAAENVALGRAAMQGADGQSTGARNVGIGDAALNALTTGSFDVGIGYNAGGAITTGQHNVLLGGYAGDHLQTKSYNIAIGGYALRTNATGGHGNIAIGYFSGYSATGGYNIFLGYGSGSKQTTNSNLFIVDNVIRADVATELTNSMLYGVMAAAPANQTLRINAMLTLSQIKSGATQAAAGAAASELWKTSGHASLPDNVIMIGV